MQELSFNQNSKRESKTKRKGIGGAASLRAKSQPTRGQPHASCRKIKKSSQGARRRRTKTPPEWLKPHENTAKCNKTAHAALRASRKTKTRHNQVEGEIKTGKTGRQGERRRGRFYTFTTIQDLPKTAGRS